MRDTFTKVLQVLTRPTTITMCAVYAEGLHVLHMSCLQKWLHCRVINQAGWSEATCDMLPERHAPGCCACITAGILSLLHMHLGLPKACLGLVIHCPGLCCEASSLLGKPEGTAHLTGDKTPHS